MDESRDRPQEMNQTAVKSTFSLADTVPGKYAVCVCITSSGG